MEENKKIQEKVKIKVKKSAKKFKNELKKSINTALVAAFGFLIALSWREVITEYVTKITEANPLGGKLISAIIITIISVSGILIVTRMMNNPTKDEK